MTGSSARCAGGWVWRGGDAVAQVAFTGKGSPPTPQAGLKELDPGRELGQAREVAFLRQIHSAEVRPAAPGRCGEGDALWTRRRGLALAVVTADCVPVLLAAKGAVAAAHAGWRGIVAGVVTAALRSLGTEAGFAPSSKVRAWIGPAIGPCCYEVGEDVAEKVAAASEAGVVLREGRRPRPHLDLQQAVAAQLGAAGVEAVETVPVCTRCAERDLWSYRRDGAGAGRNRAFIWLRDATP